MARHQYIGVDMPKQISDTGLTVVYEPEKGPTLVDIVIIHGLQGHTTKTWTYSKAAKKNPASVGPSPSIASKKGSSSVLKSFLRRWKKPAESSKTSSAEHSNVEFPEDNDGEPTSVFWPADLLPQECPNARIFVYGYDTKITKYLSGPPNKSNLFSHGKDLLFALGRIRVLDRPLIFVAHSLGGILLKEMLAYSSNSPESKLHNVVDSTAAAIFLGTPHRGSPDLAALGEWARTLFSGLRMETSSAILDALGLKTSDLERAQDSFSRLWQKHDFRVKTFQEGLGLTGVKLGVLGNKVVPDYSSLIGDSREQAETIGANHMDMCRYSGRDDPHYRKVVGEIESIYLSLVNLRSETELTEAEKACLQSLRYPGMNSRQRDLESPSEGTCAWLFEHESYHDWLSSGIGLLWLKGKPGSGKSTLMKQAFTQIQAQQSFTVASFFFSAKGEALERSPAGMYRSLLYQLLPYHRQQLQEVVGYGGFDTQGYEWGEEELKRRLQSLFTHKNSRKTVIFIDALDECDEKRWGSLAHFWRNLIRSTSAAGADLRVCLSSRQLYSVTVSGCVEIIMDQYNSVDIATFVDQKFNAGIATAELQWTLLREEVVAKSEGVFLWVILVVDRLLRMWDAGRNVKFLLKELSTIPAELESLFSEILSSVPPQMRQTTLRLFQWVILSSEPLRLYEWHHVMAFIQQPNLMSLEEWRASENFTENDDQLERRIRSLSSGLVEVKKTVREADDEVSDWMSECAAAGSLDLDVGETRVVQVIHESVREYFLQSSGFSDLEPCYRSNPIGNSHLVIFHTCLDYLNIKELDALVNARLRQAEKLFKAEPTTASFELKVIKDADDQQLHISEAAHETKILRRSSVASFSSASSHTGDIVVLPMKPCIPVPVEAQKKRISFSSQLFTRTIPAPDDHSGTESSSVGESAIEDDDWEVSVDSAPIRNTDSKDQLQSQSTPRPSRTSAVSPEQKLPVAFTTSTSEWLVATRLTRSADGHRSPEPPPSPAHSVSTTQSQLLTSHLALLSYATFEMFSHAKQAEETGVDLPLLSSAVIRLLRPKVWERWLALREDLPGGMTPLYYVATRNLGCWAREMILLTRAQDPLVTRFLPSSELLLVLSLMQAVDDENSQVVTGLLLKCCDQSLILRSHEARAILEKIVEKADCRLLQLFLSHLTSPQTGRPDREVVNGRANFSLLDLAIRTLKQPSAFLSAVYNGQNSAQATASLEVIRILLDNGADVNACTKEGETPLHTAINDPCCAITLVKMLLDHGANVNATNIVGETPLHKAITNSCCSTTLIKMLLDHGADVNATTVVIHTPLYQAISHPDRAIALVHILLEHGARVDAEASRTQMLLHRAIYHPSDASTLVEILLDRGADVNARNWSDTPLHAAVSRGNYEMAVIEILLERGADVNARTGLWSGGKWTEESDETPMHLALRNPDCGTALVKMLVDRGADLEARNLKLETPLHYAVQNGNREVLTELLQRKSNGALQDQNGRTPLHTAVTLRRISIVEELLLKDKSALEIEDNSGCTPLAALCKSSLGLGIDWEILVSTTKLLLEHGAKVNAAARQEAMAKPPEVSVALMNLFYQQNNGTLGARMDSNDSST